MAKNINLGKVGITTEGDYNSSQSYDKLTCVYYNYSSWVSRKSVPQGVVPSEANSAYWQKVSGRGAQGIQGEKGEQGIQGVQGPQGNSGYTGAAGELEIVNNLTDGGATAALSAEMGKTLDGKLTELSMEIDKQLWEKGYVSSNGQEEADNDVSRTYYIPCKVGDIVKGNLYKIRVFDEEFNYIGEENPTSSEHIIATSGAAYIRAIALNHLVGEITINGASAEYKTFRGIPEMYQDLLSADESIRENIDSINLSIGEYKTTSGYYIDILGNGVVEFYEDASGQNKSIRFKVKEGDTIAIKQANGGDGIRLWLFVNDNMNVISRSEAYVNAPVSIVAPKGATQAIIQSTSSEIIIDYGVTQKIGEVAESVSALRTDVSKQLDGGIIEEIITDFANKGVWLYGNDVLESAQYNVTKYIIIDSATEITLTNVWASTGGLLGYAIYDAKKNLLASNPTPSATGLQNYTLTSADLPEGAMYLRATQNTLHEASVRVISDYKGVKNEIAELKSGGSQLSSSAYIALPVPELAMVNIISENLPETKTADIEAVMEFNDMQGNIIKKNIIINAQGNSTLGHAKKNFSIDIVDSKYDESHSIKFGDWVAQDSYHLKSYMLDTTRVKAMAAYDFYESILLTRNLRSNRTWKRLQLPTNIPVAATSVTGEYLAMDSGAKCHPMGFPFILSHNGEFYGIYCWQLKKHRDNYHQKKDKAEHIHLDGNISNELLWNANGTIDWSKWSGVTAETTGNTDGIEIRNPKSLILVDKSKYDGDDNRGELISTSSPNYDANNTNMVMTAKVRASIESLSSRMYAITQMTKGDAKKAAIAELFDVDSIIDYIIFSQVVGNVDGYAKNWQWTTYDGVKWCVNAYDLDAVWGWGGSDYSAPLQTFVGYSIPPVAVILENYLDELKARYAELRRLRVITAQNMLKPLFKYVQVIGADYYKQEYAKWPFGKDDNIWRFETWSEESIRLTDELMGFVE